MLKDELDANIRTLPAEDGTLRALLVHLFADLPDAVLFCNSDRVVTVVNESALKLFRYDHDELIGRSMRDLYADPADYARQGEQRFHQGAKPMPQAYLMCYRRKDGSTFEGETIGAPVTGVQRDVISYLGIIRDTTARVATERALSGLHRITSDPDMPFEQRRHAILELGCLHFGMPIGIISQIDGERYEVVDAVDPGGGLNAGDVFPLAETYCDRLIKTNHAFALDRVAESDLCTHPGYKRFELESYIGTPIMLDGEILGTLNFSSSVPTGEFTTSDLDLIGMFGQWLSHEIARERNLAALREAHDQLSRIVRLDALTGLKNRRTLTEDLDQELERARRAGCRLSVAIVDFDHFKRVNDEHGHAAGDAALQLFAELATANMRRIDSVGRWGGEEFLILLPGTDVDVAGVTLARLSDRIRQARLDIEGRRVALSVSIGVTDTSGDESADVVLKRADDALYRAKAAGRDRVLPFGH